MDANMDRRAFLLFSAQDVTTLAGTWVAIPAEKVTAAEQGGVVDAELATWLEGRIEHLWHLDDLIGGTQCLELAQADLQLVSRLLDRGRYSEHIERRLYGAAGELLRFAGWSAFDADRHAAAERYWHAGLRTSAAGGDPLTGAYVLSQMAMQRTYAGDGRTAVNLLEAARERIGPRASRTVHAMLDAWQVRAHAVLGEPREAMSVLSRADDHWEHRDPDADPRWMYWMRRPSWTIEVGMALVTMGQSDTAVRLLEEGMADRTSDYNRDIVLGLAAIADAQLDQRDLDGAIDTASRAVELVAEVDSSRVADQLRAFARRLPAKKPAAEEFRGHLDTLLPTS
ncbi:hypothetical protein [Planotetraspora sp. GP83]|uniref:hypothetical protein n=1 Tax=Planotetraspora sp. GP83 TaxID=3156264 RepID=UPI0035158EC5